MAGIGNEIVNKLEKAILSVLKLIRTCSQNRFGKKKKKEIKIKDDQKEMDIKIISI